MWRALAMAELGGLLHRVDAERRGRIAARAVWASKACGCTAATVALLGSSVATAVWWLWRHGFSVVEPDAEVALLVIVAVTLATKVGTLLAAYAWLRVTVWRLRRGCVVSSDVIARSPSTLVRD
jgi:hypothetical protein